MKLIVILIGLTLLLGGGTAGAEEEQQKQINSITVETQTKKYPPYPDVWDWVAPVAAKCLDGQALKLDNGDILVTCETGGKHNILTGRKRSNMPNSFALHRIAIFGGGMIRVHR